MLDKQQGARMDHMKLRSVLRAVVYGACVLTIAACDNAPGPPKLGGGTTGAAPIPSVQMSGGMNQWLSDGRAGLQVNKFGLDPTGPSSSPVAYYRVRFAVRNFSDMPMELNMVSVEFVTADLAEKIPARIGDTAAREIKPYKNEINWTLSLDNAGVSRISHVLGPQKIEVLESSGHFYFGESDPSVIITLHRAGANVGGPFRVALGRRLTK